MSRFILQHYHDPSKETSIIPQAADHTLRHNSKQREETMIIIVKASCTSYQYCACVWVVGKKVFIQFSADHGLLLQNRPKRFPCLHIVPSAGINPWIMSICSFYNQYGTIWSQQGTQILHTQNNVCSTVIQWSCVLYFWNTSIQCYPSL